MPDPPGTHQRLADRLLSEGRIGQGDHQRALEWAARQKGRIEDALLDLEILPEAELLRFIATLHTTQFVSTEKLSKAAINQRTLGKVPVKLANLHHVFPVLYDERTQMLSVVTADPDNLVALRELKVAAGVKDVRALVTRPAAVLAAIQRHYRNDAGAFNAVLRPLGPQSDPMNHVPSERVRADGSEAATAPRRATPAAGSPAAPPAIAPTASPEFLETLNVLVSLLENPRQDLRGHSSTVARLVRRTCERIGLGAGHVGAYVAAAQIHDLGKMGSHHLTALNVAEYEGHRIAALKAWEVPGHLMESVGLASETIAAVASMYERYDGEGFPNGQTGKEIPLGGRILAVVDTYADLTQNPRNPYRKILRPFEACDVLSKFRGSIFDPNIVDLFRQVITGDDIRAKLLADRYQALIVDADPEQTTVLELRLLEQGFEVRIARSKAQARRDLEVGDIDVVVSEIDVGEPEAGLALRAEAMKQPWGRNVVWVVLTSKTDRQAAQKAFDLGVDDFVAKPASANIVVAKLRQLIERRATRATHGVSGSLAEMSLPNVVQVLCNGRKTCALKIQANGRGGEIHFAEGQIVDASWGSLKAEAAFYQMLTLRDGDFRLDPTFKPGARTIKESPEALLLEGMRLIDEARS